jgi:hypothetical protein
MVLDRRSGQESEQTSAVEPFYNCSTTARSRPVTTEQTHRTGSDKIVPERPQSAILADQSGSFRSSPESRKPDWHLPVGLFCMQ